MIRTNSIIRAFAIVGFCNGVLVSGLYFFEQWRGLHTGQIEEIIVLILFPTMTYLWEYEGGNGPLVFYLFLLSIVNAGLYAFVGLIIASAIATWRKLWPRRV